MVENEIILLIRGLLLSHPRLIILSLNQIDYLMMRELWIILHDRGYQGPGWISFDEVFQRDSSFDSSLYNKRKGG